MIFILLINITRSIIRSILITISWTNCKLIWNKHGKNRYQLSKSIDILKRSVEQLKIDCSQSTYNWKYQYRDGNTPEWSWVQGLKCCKRHRIFALTGSVVGKVCWLVTLRAWIFLHRRYWRGVDLFKLKITPCLSKFESFLFNNNKHIYRRQP